MFFKKNSNYKMTLNISKHLFIYFLQKWNIVTWMVIILNNEYCLPLVHMVALHLATVLEAFVLKISTYPEHMGHQMR